MFVFLLRLRFKKTRVYKYVVECVYVCENFISYTQE
jgi:hypothetical protein